ncbi:UNKNOWN [Stylonychia lemnae]|uniref:Proteinase inhibitor I42 chagasin domain-containing protein n=1 Tax=Stylonychia lemnae TaxID=5949 RepID=A0A078AH37_STYLE|nr:UNKNOWN [Stylonychia lemnae]|eukprot:CDW80832.1 UNKNOWN [Stylonychia lemnae]
MSKLIRARLLLPKIIVLALISSIWLSVEAQRPPPDIVKDTTTGNIKNPNFLQRINQNLILKLEDNPSTGYSWIIFNEAAVNEKKVIEFTNVDFESSNSGMLGAPGKIIYTIKGLKSGIQGVQFLQMQQWNLQSILTNGRIDPIKAQQQGITYNLKTYYFQVY